MSSSSVVFLGVGRVSSVLPGCCQVSALDTPEGIASESSMQIPLDSQGSGVIHAYRLTKDGIWMRGTRRIFIEPATELSIDVRPGKETYLPAEEASIDFYVKDRQAVFASYFLGRTITRVASQAPLAEGKATLRGQFAYDGGGMGNGGLGTLFVNNEKVVEGRIEYTQAAIFSADENADVGIDLGTSVVETIGSEGKSRFTGRIPKVTVEVKEMKKADKAEEIQHYIKKSSMNL